MQLEFPFTERFLLQESIDRLKRDLMWARIYSEMDFATHVTRWFNNYVRCGDVFVYKFESQLEFPGSHYWGFEEFEP